VRRDQTAAIARAVNLLAADRRLWQVDACALALPGLDLIPHGFEHPALYELAMLLQPGDEPPLALELAAHLGMTIPSLAPGDWPQLANLVDADWIARHPAVALDITVQPTGPSLSSADRIWGPIRIERRDIDGEDDTDARAAVLAAVEEVASAVAASGELVPPRFATPWAEVLTSDHEPPMLRVRHRWIAAAPFRAELEQRGARPIGSSPSFFKELFRYRDIVLLVTRQPWGDQEWLRSVATALP
jgi:hypothetical protein